MKKLLIVSFMMLFSFTSVMAQAPDAFKYQAIIRDTMGLPLSEQVVSLNISILKGDIAGETVYSELHDVLTNKLGLISIEIGNGFVISGDFAQIKWGEDIYFVKTEIDITGGVDYTFLGASQLLSVPYALYAETSGRDLWKKSDNGIYYNDGNVGIGTDTANSRLELHDNNTNFFVRNKYSNYFQAYSSQIGIGNTTNGNAGIYFDASDGDFTGMDYGSLHQMNDLSIALSNRSDSPIRFGVGDFYGENHFKMSILASGNVGIGTDEPNATLSIQTIAIPASADKHEIVFEGQISDATDDFIRIYNGTKYDGQFIPNIWGHHESDNRYGFGFTGSINAENDYGDYAVTLFNSRLYDGAQTFEQVNNRPLFVWRNLTEPKMTMSAEGDLGIGITTPQRTLHIKDVMRLEPRSTAPANPSEGDIYMDSSEHVLKVYDGTGWKSRW